MTQLKWKAALADDQITEQDIRNTPEIHDCEWDITPWWHEPVIYLKWIGPLTIAIFALLYAGSEIVEPLGKVWAWLGLPS